MSAPFTQKWQGLGTAFPFLLLHDVLAVLSLSAGSVAISWWIATHGGAADLSIFGISSAATMLIALPLLSALGDRHPKSRLMAWGLLAAVTTALGLATMASLGIYNILPIVLIYIVEVVAFAIVRPAAASIAADLVPPERLADALSLQKSAQSVGQLAGPVAGGAIVALSSIPIALWIYTAILLIAALSAFAIPTLKPASRVRDGWLTEVRAGLRAKWHIPIDRSWTLYAFFCMMFFSPAVGMLLPLKIHSLKLNASWLGATEAALGLGMLIGAFWGAKKVIHAFGRFKACMGALMVSAVTIIGVALSAQGWLLILGFGIAGFSMSVSQLVGQTHRQLAVPDHFRSRFSSVNMMVMQISGMLGPAIAGLTLGFLDISAVYTSFGICLLLITMLFPLVPGIQHFLALDHTEVKDWYGKLYPELFSQQSKPLSV
ncbi:MFS transporter [Iodobacter fluviatilis]|uniref:Multidrug efflux pump Tap n=1 Tax=Iodobacter fluviatilis TaxID=537 RepID=A0A377Q8Y4_9NEIS|nr:MFS transporter [Iodobacter fluviatilis]TCU88652.1 putative MFS family arabinose efflux permease [Iodobacter fluviatilis]STQ91277.1 enterobactin exporter EntS [Iodobacter fluviatilis]